MDKKKISSINQKEHQMISTQDLKLKITSLFAQLDPKNRDGFQKNMKEYDQYSKVQPSEVSLDTKKGGANTPTAATEAAEEEEASLDLDELAELEQFAEANQDFLDEELGKQEQQFVNMIAVSEGETIYRKDEIVSELFDEFRQSGASTIFSNEDKLNLWIHEMLDLVEKVSTKDLEGRITGFREVTSTDKPIIDHFEAGEGTGVSWVVPVSEERKKVYDVGNDGSFFYSADRDQELKKEEKIIEADPKNVDPETKFRGYDAQQRALYALSKPYDNTEEVRDGNDGMVQKNKNVYFVTDEKAGVISLGKRVVEHGVHLSLIHI